MNKTIFYIILFVLFSFIAEAQNLVPNPGFENYTNCPILDGQIQFGTPWTNPHGGTPDLFNECANPSFLTGVPDNWRGSQTARNGKGYAGFFTYTGEPWEAREYIQTTLNSPLISGETYYVEFYVSLSDYSENATKLFGIHFSNDPVNSSNISALTCCEAQVFISSFVLDYLGWVKVSGCYVANGGEEYLTIGNFNDDPSTPLYYQPSQSGGDNSSYYYIDDISVIHKTNLTECEELAEGINIPNIFSPNQDMVNEFWTVNFIEESEYINIFNRWGNIVAELSINSPSWDGTFNSENCLEGSYFYSGILRGEQKSGFIQLIR